MPRINLDETVREFGSWRNPQDVMKAFSPLFVGIENLATAAYGKNLSGGQRQRIALARGLICNAQYIVLDKGTQAQFH